ncbi:pyridoxamine 5'-phosphate oxidase family protein [Pseudoduganella chitinolytica]|uniref:Pyridoxamine 5'-phosphate oxidase family protein n=1 Tax=Pseudoduganella chitinolytica TaxID=34070 RepID=A0ABY8BBT9_9BURK|nr:pyridoxamine 5'-phosphate oxidase family protein [Pseudoduganella chitinolytica]WEF33372.1 pyridoxamine 5'-phosphate oxidase family protein [Pseudoduganella chitinolytica]
MTIFTKDELDDLTKRVKDVKFGMFTTSDDEHRMTSRPLTLQQIDEAGTMWFFVSDEEEFTTHLLNNPSVNVSFADVDDHLYVSIAGRASLVRDRAKMEQLWKPSVKAWFPEGLDDPHLALLEVQIQSAEYWDTGNSKMVSLFGMAKAAITGKRPTNVGEHKHLGH